MATVTLPFGTTFHDLPFTMPQDCNLNAVKFRARLLTGGTCGEFVSDEMIITHGGWTQVARLVTTTTTTMQITSSTTTIQITTAANLSTTTSYPLTARSFAFYDQTIATLPGAGYGTGTLQRYRWQWQAKYFTIINNQSFMPIKS